MNSSIVCIKMACSYFMYLSVAHIGLKHCLKIKMMNPILSSLFFKLCICITVITWCAAHYLCVHVPHGVQDEGGSALFYSR